MTKRMLYYFKIWWMMSKNSFLSMLAHRVGVIVFLLGKILRFTFFVAFIYFLLVKTETLAGYTLNQTIFFFLTFNLIDIVAQFLFREVYRFRPLVVSGGFDLVLTKPISALFRSLMGGADVLDLITIPPLFAAIYYLGRFLNPLPIQVLFYLLLIFNGLIIATAFHIAVLSLGIITLEIDHTIMIYRDLVNLGRFPIEIYKQPLRGILTYLIPVGIMISLPAKSLMGLVISVSFWNFALKHYTSASS